MTAATQPTLVMFVFRRRCRGRLPRPEHRLAVRGEGETLGDGDSKMQTAGSDRRAAALAGQLASLAPRLLCLIGPLPLGRIAGGVILIGDRRDSAGWLSETAGASSTI